jgi:hypothetical protein
MGKNWIVKATKNVGGLHRSLGMKMDMPIGGAMIKKAMKMGGKAKKQAMMAKTLAKLRKR